MDVDVDGRRRWGSGMEWEVLELRLAFFSLCARVVIHAVLDRFY